MPVIYETRAETKAVGILCDKCGNKDREGNGFSFDYTFGYGSLIDGSSVSAALCDDCFQFLIQEHVPGAAWKHL